MSRRTRRAKHEIRKNKSLFNMDIKINNLINILLTYGFIICNSPKIMKFLHDKLQKMKLKVRTEIVGDTGGKKDLCRWASGKHQIGWDFGRIAKWIHQKRLTYEILKEGCVKCGNDTFNFDDVTEAFGNKSLKEIRGIISDKWGEYLRWTKWTPFDWCYIINPIKKIILIGKPLRFPNSYIDIHFSFV